jgi:L-seryl-tRNA(Ser) seleniumtransferase
MQQREDLLRSIPHVDKLMKNEAIINCEVYRHEVTEAVRDILTEIREGLMSGKSDAVPGEDEIARMAVALALERTRVGVRRVINGTGVILHSNLGRACLSKAAADAAYNAAASYCTLEYDVEKGERGSRTECVEEYIYGITNCESLIVNNNAAAVLLILSAVASGGNVIVSRGELVEIGGGFRVPDIISLCGCTLREVGTTNKTHIADYEEAIDGDTKALLKVHSSNFKIVGFSQSVEIKGLAALGKARGIPVIEDIGSGALVDVRRYGIYGEPFAAESLENGADIVSFSGDKLLGGPQCGIVLGQDIYIDAMKKHPLYRALRADKMTIAALEATLRVYADPREAEREIPVLAMLSLTDETLRSRAEKLLKTIRQRGADAEIVCSKSVAGGGAVPGLELDSYAVSLTGEKNAETIAQDLRSRPVPIIGRIENDRLMIDVRTVFEDDFDYIAEAVANILTYNQGS